MTDNLVEGEDPPEWAIYKTAEEAGWEESTRVGELSDYPNSGYFLLFDPAKTTQESYLEQFQETQSVLFKNGARSVNLEFAVYSP